MFYFPRMDHFVTPLGCDDLVFFVSTMVLSFPVWLRDQFNIAVAETWTIWRCSEPIEHEDIPASYVSCSQRVMLKVIFLVSPTKSLDIFFLGWERGTHPNLYKTYILPNHGIIFRPYGRAWNLHFSMGFWGPRERVVSLNNFSKISVKLMFSGLLDEDFSSQHLAEWWCVRGLNLGDCFIHLEHKLLLISINVIPKTRHSCLKKWYTRFSRQSKNKVTFCVAKPFQDPIMEGQTWPWGKIVSQVFWGAWWSPESF